MRVFVTQAIDPAGLAILTGAGLDVQVREGPAPITRAELLDRVRGCAGLLSMPTERIDGEVLDAGPVRVVAQHAVGIDNIVLDDARARGVVVTHTPGVLTEATADLTLALLLALARHIVPGHACMAADAFGGWHPLMLRGLDRQGAGLGIVGMGRIGQAVAHRARAFGMEVVHSSRTSGMPLAELLATSDVVSLHCPLTPDTRHLVNATTLALMKPTALLLNTARGPVVDEDALADALQAGSLGGAGLDVHEHEPRVHPRLAGRDDVVLLPHLGSATHGARRAMATMAANNLVAALRGEAPPNRVA